MFKPAKTENELEPALAVFLDRKFPEFLPQAVSIKMFEALIPVLRNCCRELLRARILQAAAELPLRDLVRDIEAASGDVRIALAKHAAVERQVEDLQTQEAKSVEDPEFDPVSAADTTNKIASLNRWLRASSPLLAATEKLRLKLDRAAKAVPAVTRHAGNAFIFLQPLASWVHRHPSIVLLAPIPSATRTLKIAAEAVAEILVLEEGKIPQPPNPGCGEQSPWGVPLSIGFGLTLPIE